MQYIKTGIGSVLGRNLCNSGEIFSRFTDIKILYVFKDDIMYLKTEVVLKHDIHAVALQRNTLFILNVLANCLIWIATSISYFKIFIYGVHYMVRLCFRRR